MPDRIRAIIIKEKQFLLVTGSQGDLYWTPGGKQELGETHEQTLRRELMEEVSLSLESMSFLKSVPTLNKKNLAHYYLCTVSGEPKPGKEIKDFAWFRLEDYKERRGIRLAKMDSPAQTGFDIILDKLHSEGLI